MSCWLKRSASQLLKETIQRADHTRSSFNVSCCTPCFGIACLISYIGISCFVGEDSCTILAFHNGRRVHPGATMGRGVFIDHGMGIVIGKPRK